MAFPNKGDRDMTALNFLASMMMEASIWFNLVSIISTHVETGSQQFDNLGQYVMSNQMSATASVKIVLYLPLSVIVMGLTLPVRS